jgi:nucleoside 2-deoxyribosyltransferase
MRVYISGPMTGLPEFNFPAFHAAAAAWKKCGWEVINPATAFDGATDRPYQDYVRKDLADLQTCDAIAMLPGWDNPDARGSVWEREVAVLFGIPVFDATDPVEPILVMSKTRYELTPKGWAA